MDDDVLIIVVLLLGVGVAAWLIMRNRGTAMVEPPCNVGVTYSGVGVAVPCGAIKDIPGAAVELVKTVPTQVLKPLAGSVAKSLGFGSTVTNPNDCDSWGGRAGKLVESRGGTCNAGTGTGDKVSTQAPPLSAERKSALLSSALGASSMTGLRKV